MKIPSISPLLYLGIGIAVSVGNLIIDGQFDPFVTLFFLLAAFIEIIARRQKRVPSILITFVVSLAIIFFLRTNVIMLKTLPNSSAEPYIQKGATVFYQPNFYSIRNNDLIIIKNYESSRSLICKVLDVKEHGYQLEIISRRQIIETPKDNIEGKIVYVTKGEKKNS